MSLSLLNEEQIELGAGRGRKSFGFFALSLIFIHDH